MACQFGCSKGRCKVAPSDVLQRTYQLKYRNNTGTCFAVDVDAKQYLVTARHVVEGIAQRDRVALTHEGQWVDGEVDLVGAGQGNLDIAVISPLIPLIIGNTLLCMAEDLFLSMDVYFLGFPYGLQMSVPKTVNSGYPIPLVKRGIISCFDLSDGKYSHPWLDGHNNPGFSGGPVVAHNHKQNRIGVIGVVSGYKSVSQEVMHQSQATPLTIQYNTGIINTVSIAAVLDIIRANPIGCQIP